MLVPLVDRSASSKTTMLPFSYILMCYLLKKNMDLSVKKYSKIKRDKNIYIFVTILKKNPKKFKNFMKFIQNFHHNLKPQVLFGFDFQ